MHKYRIQYVKDGKEFEHDYKPDNLEHALRIGHELTRDYMADYFKVTRVVMGHFSRK